MGNHKGCPYICNRGADIALCISLLADCLKKIPDFHAEIRAIANHAAEARVYVTFSRIHEEVYKV